MKTLWLHARNCPIRWAVPLLAILDIAVLFLRSRYWIGVWPDAGAAAQVPTYVIGPLVAGAAAWSSSATARHALSEQLAAARVHHAVAEAYRLGATVILLTVPYFIGQVLAVVLTARTHPPGVIIWAGYFGHGLFVTLLTISLGWIIGRLPGSVFGAVASAMACFLFIGVGNRWLDFTIISGHVESAIAPVTLAVRIGLLAVLLLALVWVPASAPIHPRALLGPAIVGVALVVVMSATSATMYRDPPGDDVLCVRGRTTLCVWPEHEKYLPMLRAINSRVDTLPSAFVLPPRMNEFGIERTWHMEDGARGPVMVEDRFGLPEFIIIEGSIWSAADAVATGVMSTTFEYTNREKCRWDSRTDEDRARLDSVQAWLEGYLANGVTPDYETNAPPEMQKAMAKGHAMAGRSRADQFSWAEREVRDFYERYCK